MGRPSNIAREDIGTLFRSMLGCETVAIGTLSAVLSLYKISCNVHLVICQRKQVMTWTNFGRILSSEMR